MSLLGVGTLFGTAVRIPHEVLKQRLQCGQHPDVVTAFRGAGSECLPSLFPKRALSVSCSVP
jgi:hypothetical protein